VVVVTDAKPTFMAQNLTVDVSTQSRAEPAPVAFSDVAHHTLESIHLKSPSPPPCSCPSSPPPCTATR